MRANDGLRWYDYVFCIVGTLVVFCGAAYMTASPDTVNDVTFKLGVFCKHLCYYPR